MCFVLFTSTLPRNGEHRTLGLGREISMLAVSAALLCLRVSVVWLVAALFGSADQLWCTWWTQ
jgi:hypothetical protein